MSTDFTYTGVRVYNSQVSFVPSVADELAESAVDHAIFLTWLSGKWTKKPLGNSIVAVCSISVPAPQAFMICATGEVVIASRSGYATEIVDPSDNGPSHLAPLRAACTVEDRIFVAGMARRVYSRVAEGTWQPIDSGVFVPRSQRTSTTGFLCICGFNSRDIFAAGYKGEIWHYDGKSWVNQESPTNLALSAMRCADDGLVYIAGLAGTIIRGRAGTWETIQHNVTVDDFWGAAIFKGTPHFATRKAVYRLVGNDLELVDFGSLGQITTGHLDCDSEVMWSVGSKHLASTRDGQNWQSVPGP